MDSAIRTVYVPVVVYIPVNTSESDRKSLDDAAPGSIIIAKHKSPRKIKKIGQLKSHLQIKRKSSEHKKTRSNENSCETSTSCYYQSAFISNPCEQLFGPSSVDLSLKHMNEEATVPQTSEPQSETTTTTTESSATIDYIPTPRWSKTQLLTLEELYRKGRFPKSIEIKSIAQQLKVMDSDVEEWFRKRRGRDRKTRRKNDNLKSLIDNYLDN